MLRVTRIENTGDVATEYVMLKAEKDCNMGDYLLTDSTYGSDEAPSNKLRHVYFFPPKLVKAGEYVSLWTRAGSSSTGRTTNDQIVHRIFWGLKETVWNVTGDKAFLFRAPRDARSSHTVAAYKK